MIRFRDEREAFTHIPKLYLFGVFDWGDGVEDEHFHRPMSGLVI